MAGSRLDVITQEDYSAGMQRDVAPHLIDPRGAWDIVNGLVDDDGSIYKRGGTANKSAAAFGASLRFLWEGYLKPGRRTVFANTADYGVLAADDTTVVNLGGSGRQTPAPAAELRGLLFLPVDAQVAEVVADTVVHGLGADIGLLRVGRIRFQAAALLLVLLAGHRASFAGTAWRDDHHTSRVSGLSGPVRREKSSPVQTRYS